jgi:hypothetical protein
MGVERGLSGVRRKAHAPFLGGGCGSNVASLPECAEHVQQFGGESPLPNLMEVKG